MSQTVQANPKALIESLVKGLQPESQDDARNLLTTVLDNLTALSPGGNLLQPGGIKAGSAAAPVGVTHTVTGANAAFNVAITNPPSSSSKPIYHEISYSPLVSFTKGVTTMPPTTATSVAIPAPGSSGFFRIRSSYDQTNWSPYQLSSTSPIDAGLVESSAISDGAAFNQTNYAVVSSAAAGSGANITISGTGGPFTPYTRVKGPAQSTRPSATIVGLAESTDQFVGWDGSQYQLRSTLASTLPDALEPVGKVTIGSGEVGGGTAVGGNGGRLTAV
jgi:hypothetical protein